MASSSLPTAVESVLASFHEEAGLQFLSRTETVPSNPRSTAIALNYLREGGANVVYTIQAVLLQRIDVDSASELNDTPRNLSQRLQGKVLRIRKEQSPAAEEDAEITPYVATAEVESYFNDVILPRLGGQHLLHHDMISISQELIRACNAALATADYVKSRPKRRRNDRLKESEPHALLLDDMRPHPGVSFMIEFKPKWLSDSPNPRGLKRKRCRTCALRAKRTAEKHGPIAASTAFCPLALTCKGRAMNQSIQRILEANGARADPMWSIYGEIVTKKLEVDFTSGSAAAILSKLKALEEELDPHGCIDLLETSQSQNIPSVYKNLELAMTLRDCTIFARFNWNSSGTVEVKLADLDRKDWKTRLERWCATENALLEEGWYSGANNAGNPTEDTCILWQK